MKMYNILWKKFVNLLQGDFLRIAIELLAIVIILLLF